jgi:hypothetical protein
MFFKTQVTDETNLITELLGENHEKVFDFFDGAFSRSSIQRKPVFSTRPEAFNTNERETNFRKFIDRHEIR